MKILKSLVKLITAIIFTVTISHGADLCTSDGSATFTQASTSYSNSVATLAKFQSDYYYFNISTAGTLTVTVASTGNKVDLAYSDTACPTASATGVQTRVVTASSAMDLNIALYATNDSGYTITATFVPAPVVSISCPSNSIVEGNVSNTTTTCTISLNTSPLLDDIQLTVQGVDVTSSNGTDYNASSTNITFLRNTLTLSQNYSFDVIGDTTYETNELFNIRVINNPAYSSATQLRQLPADYPITIVNDDAIPSLLISIGDTSKTEGDVGTAIMNFPITLSAPATTDITVTYRFNDVNTSSSDTNMTNGGLYSFVIPSGTEVGLYTVTLLGIVGDTFIEPDEIFTITLEATSNGVIDAANSTATGTVLDDDGGGVIIIPAYDPGTVDTVDVYTVTGISPFYEQVIKTKIAGQTNLTLDAIYLGLTAPFVPTTYTAANMPVIMYLYDPISESVTKLYEQASLTTPLAAVIQTNTKWGRTPLFTMPATAKKEAYILMKYLDYNSLLIDGGPTCLQHSSTGANDVPGMPSCVASDVQYLDAFHQEAYDRCKVQHGEPCKPSFHGYSGGGDPNYPGYDPEYDHKYGCYECTLGATPLVRSVDNFTIRPGTYTTTIAGSSPLVAGQEFDITTVAKPFNINNSLTGYNGIAAVAPQTQISTCAVPDGNLTNSSDTSFNSIVFNGVDTNVSNNIKFGDVGVFDMNITDSTWTAVDNVKIPIECIDGSHTNVVDVNGKVGCLVRITANPIVIPDHFNIDGNLTNGSNGFTYLNNFEDNASLDQNISARLNAVVTAKAFDINSTTLNYSSECYAKDGNSTINLVLTPAPNNLTQLIWYDDNNNSVVGNFAIAGPFSLPHPAARFTNPGVGTLKYRLNFDRSIIAPVNPFQMTIPQMVVTDTDNVDGNNSIDNNATYLFGRTHASRQRYYDTTAPYQGLANIYYESFCFGALCNKTLLPNGVNSTRTDDVRWYVIPNPFHTTPTDGLVGTVVQKGGLNIVTASPQAPTTGNPSTTTLTYTGAKGFPYKTTMENNASIWLIQNETNPNATKNEFQVEFDLSGGWTGEHETNTTTKTPAGTTTNRRIMW